MQLRALLFLFFFGFFFSTIAQSHTAVWEGSFYLRGRNHKINVRIEVAQKEKEMIAVVSTRGFKKNTVYGCDYIVRGQQSKNKLTLFRQNVQRGVAMSIIDCSSFDMIELTLNKDDSTAKVRWFWGDSSKNTFVARRTAIEISETAKEEMTYSKGWSASRPRVAKYNIEDYAQFRGYMGVRWVENKEMSITVNSVEKTPRSTITVTLNDRTVADNFNLSENVLVIRLKDIAQVNNLDFINNSDRRFNLDVRISFQQEEDKEEWTVSILPGGNVSLRLNRKE